MSTRDRPSSVISLKMVLMTEGVLSFGQKRVGVGRKFVWAPVGLVAVEGGPRNTLWSFKPSVTPHALSAAQAPTGGWVVGQLVPVDGVRRERWQLVVLREGPRGEAWGGVTPRPGSLCYAAWPPVSLAIKACCSGVSPSGTCRLVVCWGAGACACS